MAGEVVDLDMVHFDTRFDLWDLPHLHTELEDVGVLTDLLCVGLEVDNIHLVVPDQGHEHSNVRESQSVTTQELFALQVSLQLVKACIKIIDCCIICFLGPCKSASVHSIIDARVGPLINGSHLFLELFWGKVQVWVLGKVIELRVEDVNNLR